MANLKQKTFTAKVIIPGAKNPRYIPECIIYKGKVVALVERGVGEPTHKGYGDDVWEEYSSYVTKMKPYLSKALMGDRIAHFQAVLKKSDNLLSPENEAELLAVSFHLGENEGGYIVEDAEEASNRAKLEELKEIENKKECTVYFGIFGLQIHEQLPKSVWNLLRSEATYHDGGEDDQEWADDMGYIGATKRDLKGWYYNQKMIEILTNNGWTVKYKGIVVADIESLKSANEVVEEQKKVAKKREAEREELKNAINKKIADLKKEYLTEEQGQEVSKLPIITAPRLGWEGASIYGTGRWMAKDDQYLYLIYNNGTDGGDWRMNNVPTGGAGAIGYRIEISSETIKELLNEINNYESTTLNND